MTHKAVYGTISLRVTEDICTVPNKSLSDTLSSTTGTDDLGVGD